MMTPAMVDIVLKAANISPEELLELLGDESDRRS